MGRSWTCARWRCSLTQAVDDLYARLAAIDKRLKHIETLERLNSASFMQWLSPAVLCAEADAQTIANNYVTAIAFADADIFDTDAMHDPTTNNTRITFTAAGVYLVWGGGRWNAGSGSGVRETYLRANGTTTLPGSLVTFRQSTTTDAPGQVTMAIYSASAGQYVELCVYQNSGSNRTYSSQSFGAMRVPGA